LSSTFRKFALDVDDENELDDLETRSDPGNMELSHSESTSQLSAESTVSTPRSLLLTPSIPPMPQISSSPPKSRSRAGSQNPPFSSAGVFQPSHILDAESNSISEVGQRKRADAKSERSESVTEMLCKLHFLKYLRTASVSETK
jgi:hypothetical protein